MKRVCRHPRRQRRRERAAERQATWDALTFEERCHRVWAMPGQRKRQRMKLIKEGYSGHDKNKELEKARVSFPFVADGAIAGRLR